MRIAAKLADRLLGRLMTDHVARADCEYHCKTITYNGRLCDKCTTETCDTVIYCYEPPPD